MAAVRVIAVLGVMAVAAPVSMADYLSEWNQAVGDAQSVLIAAKGSSVFCRSKNEYVEDAIKRDGYFFCQDYVDYAIACDAQDPQSCNNRFAIDMFTNFQRAMNMYSCSTYSKIWTCTNCTDSYKRWLCSQVYKKMYLPGTERVEEGTVHGGKAPGSYAVTCPYPPASMTDENARQEAAAAKPHYVKLCNGMSNKTLNDLAKTPETVCGGQAACEGNVYLDNATASSVDDFYVGSIIEILSDSEYNGQWAVIEKYSGYARIAMFKAWNLPSGSTLTSPGLPTASDKYRIYLDDSVRGKCRDSRNPRQRLGKACELVKYPELATLPKQYMGGTRCADSEQCIPIDPAFASPTAKVLFDSTGHPKLPDSNYACCPRNGFDISLVGTGETWRVYELVSGNSSSGQINHTCVYRTGSSYDEALASTTLLGGDAKLATQAIEASGCIFNFTKTRDFALDFCVLKTCFPVCMDVVRRCPLEIEFNCPSDSDRREYDFSACNINLAEGCSMALISNAADAKLDRTSVDCWDLNVGGYGPKYSQGPNVFGLPPGATCKNKGPNVGVVALEPPKLPPAPGQKESPNEYWEEKANANDKLLRYFDPYGAKSTVVCAKPP
uniref:FZ domain-containing protein n=1 Tax=Hanusia phi TaxID=3032 RepID=A0A7S0NAE0_9CRYP|mmetsp:Transcript_4874/g.11555  ORF Transcript_4874/g.11555 Transcript_4874/m.11555 type:complete len:609 (+) Transcript_4874:37-1863(+)